VLRLAAFFAGAVPVAFDACLAAFDAAFLAGVAAAPADADVWPAAFFAGVGARLAAAFFDGAAFAAVGVDFDGAAVLGAAFFAGVGAEAFVGADFLAGDEVAFFAGATLAEVVAAVVGAFVAARATDFLTGAAFDAGVLALVAVFGGFGVSAVDAPPPFDVARPARLAAEPMVLLTTSTVALTACSAPWRSLRPMPGLSLVIRTSPLVPLHSGTYFSPETNALVHDRLLCALGRDGAGLTPEAKTPAATAATAASAARMASRSVRRRVVVKNW
jgi:hypothetical protein